jgi:hypothetical protein
MLTAQQQEVFEVLRAGDSSLTEEEFQVLNENSRIYVWSRDKENPEEAARTLARARARLHRDTVLEKFEATSGNPHGWRCYSEGVSKYRRKDGEPLTDMDVECINLLPVGQGHSVVVAEDRSYLTHKWFVDSSD